MADRQISGLLAEASTILDEDKGILEKSAHPIVKAILSTAPFGGGIASLLGDFGQERQLGRLKRFLLLLAKRVEENATKLEGKTDLEYFYSERFATIFEAVLQEVKNNADESKLRILRDYLISSTLISRPDVTWQDVFLGYIRQLSGIHLIVLAIFYEIQGRLPDSDRLGGAEIEGKVPLSVDGLRERLSDVDPILLSVVAVDLVSQGLLTDWRSLRPDTTKLQTKYCLTESGRRFICFLDGDWESLEKL